MDRIADLTQVIRHVDDAEERIACQHDLIALLRSKGASLDIAEELLSMMYGTLDLLKIQAAMLEELRREGISS